MTEYIRHVSGTGPLFVLSRRDRMRTYVQDGAGYNLILPTSEYVLCESPARWVDVTAHVVTSGNYWHDGNEILLCIKNDNYRLRKVHGSPYRADEGWAFIVEKKQ